MIPICPQSKVRGLPRSWSEPTSLASHLASCCPVIYALIISNCLEFPGRAGCFMPRSFAHAVSSAQSALRRCARPSTFMGLSSFFFQIPSRNFSDDPPTPFFSRAECSPTFSPHASTTCSAVSQVICALMSPTLQTRVCILFILFIHHCNISAWHSTGAQYMLVKLNSTLGFLVPPKS